MAFFFEQEALTITQWVLRAFVAFLFLMIITKAMGQRAISQLTLLDFVLALLIGNIMAHPLSDPGLNMQGSMYTIVTLVILYSIFIFCILKSTTLRHLMLPSPIPLIENGKIKYENLSRARVSIDYLLAELRKEKVDRIQKVAVAQWEPGGHISIFLDSPYQPVTASEMQLSSQPFTLPVPVVKDGDIIHTELNILGKSEMWLRKKLLEIGYADTHNIALATVDANEMIEVYLK